MFKTTSRKNKYLWGRQNFLCQNGVTAQKRLGTTGLGVWGRVRIRVRVRVRIRFRVRVRIGLELVGLVMWLIHTKLVRT